MTDEIREDSASVTEPLPTTASAGEQPQAPFPHAPQPCPPHHLHLHRGAVIGLAVGGALVFGAISFGTGWHARGFAFGAFGGPGPRIAWQQDGYGPSGYRGGPGSGHGPRGFRDGGGPSGDYPRGGFDSGPGMRGGMGGGRPGMRGGPVWRDDGSAPGTDTPGAN